MCSSVRHCQIQKLLIYMKSIGSVYGFASNALIKCSMLIGIPVNWYVLNENKKWNITYQSHWCNEATSLALVLSTELWEILIYLRWCKSL